jgi:hypothetical protein
MSFFAAPLPWFNTCGSSVGTSDDTCEVACLFSGSTLGGKGTSVRTSEDTYEVDCLFSGNTLLDQRYSVGAPGNTFEVDSQLSENTLRVERSCAKLTELHNARVNTTKRVNSNFFIFCSSYFMGYGFGV